MGANKRTKRIFMVQSLLSLVFIHVIALTCVSGDLPKDWRLFVIERSKNANQICYDLNFDSRGNLDADKPLKVYWYNKTDRPGAINNLSRIQEKYAYGYSSRPIGDGNYEITLVAFPKRKINLVKDSKGKYQAIILIGGKKARLTKIFVQSKAKNYNKVMWVDLYGISLNDGKQVSERIFSD